MSKFSLSLAELNSALSIGRTILGDKAASADSKFTVFTASADGDVSFAVYTPLGIVRKALDVTDADIEGTGWQFFVNFNDIAKIADVFGNLSITRVDSITFSQHERVVQVEVNEIPASDDIGNEYSNTTVYRINALGTHTQSAEAVSREVPEPASEINAFQMTLIFKSLMPVMSHDANASASSNMFMTDKHIYVQNSTMFSLFENTLPKELYGEGTAFSYTTVSALRAMGELVLSDAAPDELSEASLPLSIIETSAGRIEYFVVSHGGVDLFIKPRSNKLPSIEKLVAPMSDEGTGKDTGIVVNRQYFENILKRLAFDDKNAVFSMSSEEHRMIAETKAIKQPVPLANFRGDIDDIEFRTAPAVLSKAILGDTSTFSEVSENLFLYFAVSGKRRGYTLYVMDESGAWMSFLSLMSK